MINNRRFKYLPNLPLKLITLGGVEEIGGNSTIIEYGNNILIVDLGLGFPDETEPGIKIVLPDIKYLTANKKKIRGILITHGHMDHIGALPYLLSSIGFPTIYSTLFTSEMIKSKLKEFELDRKVKLVVVPTWRDIQIGPFKINFVKVTHSIPDSTSLYIKTPKGGIFISGDYKFDDTPLNESKSDYYKLRKIGYSKPILGLFESTYVFQEGKSKSEQEVYTGLYDIISKAKGRVIVTTFSSMVTRIYALVDIAYKLNRKIIILGRSIRNAYEVALKTKYIQKNKQVVVEENKSKNLDDNKVIYLVTGTQGEPTSVLTKLSEGNYKGLKLRKDDTVIMSSSIIISNSNAVQRVHDNLIKKGVEVFHNKMMDIHASGHAYQKDMERMIKLIKPLYAMPIHGYSSFLQQNKRLLMSWGYKPENVLIPFDGSVFEYTNKSWTQTGKIEVDPVVIDGTTMMYKDTEVLKNRLQMANSGIIAISIVNPNNIHINIKGLYSQSINNEISSEIKKLITKEIHVFDTKNTNSLKDKIRSIVRKYIETEYDKTPLIIII